MSVRTGLLSLMIVVVLAVVCRPAAAQPPGGRGPGAEIRKLLEKYDADRNGSLSDAERQTLRADVQAGRVEVPAAMRGFFARGRSAAQGGAGIETDRVTIERDIEYGRAGERALKLDVVRPKEPKGEKLPVVVFIHGGGWRSGDKSGGVSRVAPFAATGDYVGVSVGYRLSGEATWPAQIHDCKAAIRWVRANAAKYGIDPERIGVWGSSAGGHLVNMLGTSGGVEKLEGENGTPGVSSRVTCAVPFCGPTNLAGAQKFEGGKRPSAVDLLLGGTIEEKIEAAREASPLTYVSADDPPFLIVHGTADNTVPFRQAETFHKALKDAGVNVTFVRIDGGGHGIGGREVMDRVKAFFEKHLRGQDVEVSDATIEAEGE